LRSRCSPAATGNASAYIAVYTGSYLAGYLALFAPGGVGVREAVLVLAMPRFQLASAADAAVIAITSRLWLTVLEIVPGVLLLRRPTAGAARPDHSDDS
jgi:glycosyltransferase 2 family protein